MNHRTDRLYPFASMALLWLACVAGAWAQQAPVAAPEPGSDQYVQEERMRIAAQRETVEAGFTAEQTQCYKRFAVNDCLQESRVRRRDALADLRRQEVSLNDAERKKRGAEQVRKVEDKVSTDKVQQADEQHRKAEDAQQRRAQDAQENAARRAKLTEEAPAQRARQQRETNRHAQDAATRTQQAAQSPANVRSYEDKLKDAAKHKAKRQEKSQQKTKPAAQALPPPPS